MDSTLVQILTELYQQRVALDAAQARIEALEAENAALRTPPGANEEETP